MKGTACGNGLPGGTQSEKSLGTTAIGGMAPAAN
jgi:hypothetical protein